MEYIEFDHKIFSSLDGWDNYTKEETIPEGFTAVSAVDSKNIANEIRIREDYPIIGKEIVSELKLINKILREKYNSLGKTFSDKDGYGSAFEVFSLAVHFDKTYQEVIDKYIVMGSEDGCIDGIVFENNIFSFFQIKLGKMTAGDFQTIKKNADLVIKAP